MAGNRLPRSLGRTVVVAILALVWLGGCGEGTGPVVQTADSVIVSNPVHVTAAAGFNASLQSGTVDAANEDLVFVALEPGTVPAGELATVRRVGATSTVTASIVAGGFDPVPVVASAGDNIEIVVNRSGSAPVSFTMAVLARCRPVVVRADPPPRKRDVPLNTALVVVFSEPVASASLAPGLELLRDSTPIPGTVELFAGTATAAVFRPTAPLDPNTDYRLVVTRAVRDLTGDALAAPDTVAFTTGTTVTGLAHYVAVVPDSSAILVGSGVQLGVVAADSDGFPVTGRPVVWSSETPAVATVSSAGLVTGVGAGQARIRASVDLGSAVGLVFVQTTHTPVASIDVTPGASTILVGGGLTLQATLRDAAGTVLTLRPVTWVSGDTTIATVNATPSLQAAITGRGVGSTTISATSEGQRGTAAITVVTEGPFAALSTSDGHTCGVTVDNWALCWGWNAYGGLGNGTIQDAAVPVPVWGGMRFAHVDVGWGSTCALSPLGSAYCWGVNEWGQLGAGTSVGPAKCPPPPAPFGLPCSMTPVGVQGGQFQAIDFGWEHVCGVAPGGSAYCWGWGTDARLGTGVPTGPDLCPNTGPCSTLPVAVVGGLTFSSITVANAHACGLTPLGAAYCWGDNSFGEVGDGTTSSAPAPVPVSGNLAFTSISAGWGFTCGLTSDGTLYCWGLNDTGELGVGTFTGPEICPQPGGYQLPACSTLPVRVSGGLQWSSVSAGAHTCGVTTSGAAYCWGLEAYGGLGIGSDSTLSTCGITAGSPLCATTPLPVAGGLTFATIAAQGGHTCGLTPSGVAYCWGENFAGQLGTGVADQDAHPAPERVARRP